MMQAEMSPVPVSMRPLMISMGDPAGIGPEIIAKALTERPALINQVVIAGDLAILEVAARCVAGVEGRGAVLFHQISALGGLGQVPKTHVPVLQACELPSRPKWGVVSAEAGKVAADCIRVGALTVLGGAACGLVTAPIHKESLALAGIEHPGHTEYLQALAAAHLGLSVRELPVRMMLSSPNLRTVLVSIHVSLRNALDAVTTDRVASTIEITHEHFCRLGWKNLRIGVAGLNPHAGEGGLFGREEIEVISPAVRRMHDQGVNVSGPHAPDTVFMRARQGEFDVVIAMYHDQGLIPVKLLGLEHGVNTTLGLPFVRTSPDHGTAFDLAGTGRASAASLLAAIDAAQDACSGLSP
jgi:4-hydroxythreonine-4-phosphate dehydrogenase